jgi:protoporphyrinogen oxidase
MDYLIVGAGIAGLYTALKLKEAKPEAHIVVIEKYNYLGGRIVTHRHTAGHTHYQWENGAGRVHRDHARVRALMRRYGLTWKPISNNSLYQPYDRAPLQPSRFQELAAAVLEPLQSLPADTLARQTIQELLHKAYGHTLTEKFLGQFAYRAEVTVMRADAAIAEILRPDGVAGPAFGVCAEGLDQIIRGLAGELAAKGVAILLGHSLEAIGPDNTLTVRATGGGLKELHAKKVILAIHAKALKTIRGISNWPLLKQLIMCPLLRTYAVYDRPWFTAKDMGGGQRIIFGSNPVRYFIPVGDRVAMCSYTDAGNTEPWMADAEHAPKRLSRRIHTALRRALGPKVPDPTYFKAHPWSAGCTYWGAVPRGTPVKTVQQLSQDALIVRPNLYATGESFSADKQTWMEGALEHADELLKKLL